jgi:hypothetical protein
MENIKQILIRRDGMTPEEAEAEIEAAQEDLHARLAEGELPFNICEEWFGLEPDYLDELI